MYGHMKRNHVSAYSLRKVTIWKLYSLSATHPKTHIFRKQREEEDFAFRQTFRCFNLQTTQALKAKSNPKQAQKNANS
jgi:hypothetical protein